jgi:hypothetical protein
MTTAAFFKPPFSAHFTGKEHNKRVHVYKEGRWAGSFFLEVYPLGNSFSFVLKLDTRDSVKTLNWGHGYSRVGQARHKAVEALREFCSGLDCLGYPGLHNI